MAGRLLDNLMHFARTLRAAGLPVGPGAVVEATQALALTGLASRDDVRAALAAVFVKRRQDRELFEEAFAVFWKDPQLLRRMMAAMLPRMVAPGGREEGSRRLAEALAAPAPETVAAETAREEFLAEVALDWSDRERLHAMDFEKMSAEEFARARALAARLALALGRVPTRRQAPDPHGGRIDLRASLRAALRGGGEAALRRASPGRRQPPLVVLCDVSGSMERYARVFLHFMHTAANLPGRPFHGFLFGTRLTNVTRPLRNRDPDAALAATTAAVADWSGGTRIGACLHAFNRLWSRRVLGQGAVVLLMTDGLDRADDGVLGAEMERLHKSCRRLVWLNPLLRWDGFTPRAAGVRAILPHVDDFRPVHNLDSLETLVAALARPAARREEGVGPWLRRLTTTSTTTTTA